MDFWTHQDTARNKSFRLIVLYAVLVLGFSALAAVGVELIWQEYAGREYTLWTWPGIGPYGLISLRFFLILLIFPALVGVMTLFSPASLASGGGSVAEAMNGVLITPQTTNSDERRLLNVVEEMAIASGTPVPPVYVLREEQSINAFAAGGTVNDAIIGVTQGALTYLKREELQGVIGHEFSHILNGDMRLNLRFARLLFGLICLSEVSGVVLRSMRFTGRKNDRGLGIIAVVAMICYFLGLILAFLGRIIQAAVNRQREFLADASSVQFTRSEGLASALKKIGGLADGSLIRKTNMVNNYQHFFFCSTSSGLFSTHPSLKQRILRLDPGWDGVYPKSIPVAADFPTEEYRQSPSWTQPIFQTTGKASTADSARRENARQTAALSDRLRAPINGATMAAAAGKMFSTPVTALDSRPSTREQALAKLHAACHEPMDACHLIFGLLLDDDPKVRARQLAVNGNAESQRTVEEYKNAFALVPREHFLPLIELAVPALKMLSARQYEFFHAAMLHYIHADGKFSFREWILYQLVVSLVGGQGTPGTKKGDVTTRRGLEVVPALLGAIARLNPDAGEAEAAFVAGLRAMQLPARPLTGKTEPEVLALSINVLRRSPKPLRNAVIFAAMIVAAHDNILTPEEGMFMRLLSLCLERPLPELPVGVVEADE